MLGRSRQLHSENEQHAEHTRIDQFPLSQRLNRDRFRLDHQPGESSEQDRQEGNRSVPTEMLPYANDASRAIKMACPITTGPVVHWVLSSWTVDCNPKALAPLPPP